MSIHARSTRSSARCDESDSDDDMEAPTIYREHNHVYFHSEVSRDSIVRLTQLLRQAEAVCIQMVFTYNLPSVPLYLHISSFGGSVFAALTAIDAIKACRVPVHTIIEGATASAGTLISVVGDRRFITPSSHMLIHQLSSGCWGKMAEIEDEMQNLKALMKQIRKIYKKHTKIPKDDLHEILKHDLWFNSKKSLEVGLVDEIWTNRVV
jgi:ATP-dependent Clp protease protease subunit